MGLIARLFLLIGGAVAGLFMAEDAFQYPVMSMVVGLLIFTLLIAIIAYRSTITGWFRRKNTDDEQT